MKFFDRIMTFLSAIVVAFLTMIVLLPFAKGAYPELIAANIYRAIFKSTWVAIVVAVLMIILVLYLLLLSVRTAPEGPRSVVRSTTMGDVKISLSAIEDLAFKVSKQHQGVREAAARVEGTFEDLSVNLRLGVYSDVSITQLCEDLEKQLSESIFQITGIEIKSVHFAINNVSGEIVKSKCE